MRLLVLSDVHARWQVRYMVEEVGDDVDAAVIAGDITNFGPPEFVEDILSWFRVPVLAVPGNCDPPRVLELLEAKRASVHMKCVEMEGMRFVGLGGSDGRGATAGITWSDEEASSFIEQNARDAVLILHQPPYGCNDDVGWKRIGNMALRKAVEFAPPRLIISGHVHEDRGVETCGRTTCVNPGPAMDGMYAVVTLSGKRVDVDMFP